MDSEEITKSHEDLLEEGFTPSQIECLRQFRNEYLEREKQRALVELRHLEFIRWLIATGRLSD
jgi:hypothetical protein